jgi:hypothetical protein
VIVRSERDADVPLEAYAMERSPGFDEAARRRILRDNARELNLPSRP